MKLSAIKTKTCRPLLAALIMAGTLISSSTSAQERSDKEPSQRSYQRDLDKELEQLEKAKANLRKQLGTDWKKKQEEMIRTLDIEMENIAKHAGDALKNVDFDAIQRQVAEAVENSARAMEQSARASEQINEEVRERVKEQMEKAKKDLEQSQLKHDKQMKEQMAKAQKQIAETKEKIRLQMPDIEKSLRSAEEGIQKAEEELKGYQEMIYAMEADGLLDTKKDYNIQLKNGKLFINDQEQPNSVYNKYKKYFKKDSIHIRKEDGKFSIPKE